MDGLGNIQPIDGFGTDGMLLAGSFATNGASQPLAAGIRTPPGLLWVPTRTGVGAYLITFAPELVLPDLPAYIEANPQCDAFANWFDTIIVGELNRTARTFTVQAHRSGVAQEVAAAAGARINWSIQFRNSTSR